MANDLGFIHAGFAMFLNYDGAGSGFGDTSLSTVVTDPQWSQSIERATAYASQDAGQPGRMVIVAINKTGGALTAGFRVTHNRRFNTAQIYRVTSASATPARTADLPLTLTNAFVDTLPAMSVTTLVLLP
jgi:O-glycosyl hydrolase